MGPLDVDLGKHSRRENPADIVGVAKGEGTGLVRGGPVVPNGAVRCLGNEPVPVLGERRPAGEDEAPARLQGAGDIAEAVSESRRT